MTIPVAFGFVRGLLNKDLIDMYQDSDGYAFYVVETDGINQRITEIRTKVAMMLDLPIKRLEIVEVKPIMRGKLITSYEITFKSLDPMIDFEEE